MSRASFTTFIDSIIYDIISLEKFKDKPLNEFSFNKSYIEAESNSNTMQRWSLNTKKSSILTKGLSPLGS